MQQHLLVAAATVDPRPAFQSRVSDRIVVLVAAGKKVVALFFQKPLVFPWRESQADRLMVFGKINATTLVARLYKSRHIIFSV